MSWSGQWLNMVGQEVGRLGEGQRVDLVGWSVGRLGRRASGMLVGGVVEGLRPKAVQGVTKFLLAALPPISLI